MKGLAFPCRALRAELGPAASMWPVPTQQVLASLGRGWPWVRPSLGHVVQGPIAGCQCACPSYEREAKGFHHAHSRSSTSLGQMLLKSHPHPFGLRAHWPCVQLPTHKSRDDFLWPLEPTLLSSLHGRSEVPSNDTPPTPPHTPASSPQPITIAIGI